MKKDELCTRYSEMSDNTLKKYLSLFKSRVLQHPAFRTCPKQLVRAPNVHSVSRTCCSAAAHFLYFWPSCKSFSAHHAGRSLAMLINHILLIPPRSNGIQDWAWHEIYSDPWKNGHVQSCDPFCSYISYMGNHVGIHDFHGISMFPEFFFWDPPNLFQANSFDSEFRWWTSQASQRLTKHVTRRDLRVPLQNAGWFIYVYFMENPWKSYKNGWWLGVPPF